MSDYTLQGSVAFVFCVQSEAFLPVQLVYVIAWLLWYLELIAQVMQRVIARGEAKCNLLHYESY